jgi:hypothetical protein
MISGNVGSLFQSIRAVSRERVDFGIRMLGVLPWVHVDGVTISGSGLPA